MYGNLLSTLKRTPTGRKSSKARQLGCVFPDMKPLKSILRKSTDMQKTIQRVKFTKAIARHAKNRDQNPSLRYICSGEPHDCSLNAPKFEDRSPVENGTTSRYPGSSVEAVKKCPQNRATFFSPSENMYLPATRICCGLRRVDAYH